MLTRNFVAFSSKKVSRPMSANNSQPRGITRQRYRAGGHAFGARRRGDEGGEVVLISQRWWEDMPVPVSASLVLAKGAPKQQLENHTQNSVSSSAGYVPKMVAVALPAAGL